jgi:hypothetical protein
MYPNTKLAQINNRPTKKHRFKKTNVKTNKDLPEYVG